MSHCFYCGRGISRKYRCVNPEVRLLQAIFGLGMPCEPCARTRFPNLYR